MTDIEVQLKKLAAGRMRAKGNRFDKLEKLYLRGKITREKAYLIQELMLETPGLTPDEAIEVSRLV